jgi:dihydroorotate dehydrogenase
MIYNIVRDCLFKFPPEFIHNLSLKALNIAAKANINLDNRFAANDLPCKVFGINFKNPIGLSAGYDKNGQYVEALEKLGFGFVEIGSVTAKPCKGNSKPRIFRLKKEKSIINRVGLPSPGADKVACYLKNSNHTVPLFINIASTPGHVFVRDSIDDYLYSFEKMAPFADVIVVNISCPNTSDSIISTPITVYHLLKELSKLRDETFTSLPIIVKIPHKYQYLISTLMSIINVCEKFDISGITISNTNPNHNFQEKGGYSGHKLIDDNIKSIRAVRKVSSIPIIGCGGISDFKSFQTYTSNGASLVQLYTGLVYNGPGTVKNILR